MFSVHFDIGNVVLKDSWDIDLLFDMSAIVLKHPHCVIVSFVWTTIVLNERMIGVRRELRTSGNVPLEKTLDKIISKWDSKED